LQLNYPKNQKKSDRIQLVKIMKFAMKFLSICAVLGAAVNLNAQTVTVDPSQAWIGFMNVNNLPADGGGYQFGSGWATGDLVATFSGSALTLSPNAINDPATYWYIGGGAPGAVGNKIMDANMYVETTGTFVNTTLTFSGNVLANTLVGQTALNGYAWTSVAFIKDFAPDYSSSTSTTVALNPGAFSISLPTGGAGDHVQYGFETFGSDVWATDLGQYGNIQIGIVPEPTTLALAGLGAAVVLPFFRRRNK
jgi:hypothetical protein